MKLMALVQQFARKPVVRLHWGKEALFFAGKQPARQSLITLDMPGLKGSSDATVREWLIEYHRKQKRRGEHTEIAEAPAGFSVTRLPASDETSASRVSTRMR